MKHLPLVLLLVAGCAAGPSSSASRSTHLAHVAHHTPPAASEGIRIVWEGKQQPGLQGLVAEYARVTGQTVLLTAETAMVIQRKTIDKAGGADVLEIAAADVQEVTEALLVMHNLVLIPVSGAEPRTVQLISLETQERNFVRRSAIYVVPEQLEAWRRRPATLITTSLRLDHLDVRQLSNSMRTMLTDANTQQIIPVGNSNCLILTGFGADVCALADLLRRIDAEAEPAAEAASTPDAGQPR